MRFPNPDAAPAAPAAPALATVPKPFLSTPGGVAVLAGVGVLLAGGVVYAMTRSSAASCAWVPASNGLATLGQPGHYRLDVGVPMSLAVKAAGAYPTSEAQWEQMLQQMAGQIPPGVAVEGIWLPAITANGQTLGPYSYPPNTPLPSDWTTPSDGMAHARMQMLWPYKSDILTALINSASITSMLQNIGVALQVLTCPTGPIPAAVAIPLSWAAPPTDASGAISATPSMVFLISTAPGTPPEPATQAQVASALTSAGFTVLASWDGSTTPNDWPSSDSGSRWRFIVVNTTANAIPLTPSSDEKVFMLDVSKLPVIGG